MRPRHGRTVEVLAEQLKLMYDQTIEAKFGFVPVRSWVAKQLRPWVTEQLKPRYSRTVKVEHLRPSLARYV